MARIGCDIPVRARGRRCWWHGAVRYGAVAPAVSVWYTDTEQGA